MKFCGDSCCMETRNKWRFAKPPDKLSCNTNNSLVRCSYARFAMLSAAVYSKIAVNYNFILTFN
eukprot:12977054-Heterocapsa_arctica.AAC.1